MYPISPGLARLPFATIEQLRRMVVGFMTGLTSVQICPRKHRHL
jgi:hypothetical protein